MSIDWFTILAQMVNFLVLMLLLRRFLYGPIVRTMDARELHITKELDEAERKEREARLEAESLRTEREDLEDRRGEMLTQAQLDAEQLRGALMEQVRDEVEVRRTGWEQAIEREKQSFLANLRQRAGEQVYAITRQVLTDLADVDLEAHIIESFINRLRTMKDPDLEKAAGSEKSAIIATAFELDGETRDRIAAAVRERMDALIDVSFEVSPGLICGIELRTSGYKAAWSLQNYLETLDENLSQAFAGPEEQPS